MPLFSTVSVSFSGRRRFFLTALLGAVMVWGVSVSPQRTFAQAEPPPATAAPAEPNSQPATPVTPAAPAATPVAPAATPVIPTATPVAPAAEIAKLNRPPFELPKDFSADVQTTQGSTVTQAKFYSADGKIRLESKVKDLPIILIATLKDKKALLVVPDKAGPEKGVFIRRDLTPANIQAIDLRSAWNDPKVTWERMPAATVDGIVCEVYKLTRPPAKPDLPAGPTHEIYINPANKLPLKVTVLTAAAQSTQLWTNVEVGPQSDTLFAEPAGYTEKSN